MLRAGGGHVVEGHMGCTADVLVRKSPTGALVASTHHALADEISSSDHKDQQNDGDDRADGVGPGVGNPTGRRRDVLYAWRWMKTDPVKVSRSKNGY